jgi:sn-glycerol 3-phosphate transport system permease protein
MATLPGVRVTSTLAAPVRNRPPRGNPAWRLAGYTAMALAVVIIGAPLYWMLTAAFKTNAEIYTAPPTWIPLHPTIENFGRAWRSAPFGRFYINSIVVTIVTTAGKMVNAVLCGYAFAFLRFPKKNLLFILILCALMIPEEVTILPNYLTVARLHWVNTYMGLIVPTFGSAFGTFLMRQHFLSLPHEVLEAAEVDGATHWDTLWRIVLPMSRPVLATLLMLTVVQRWNEFLWPLIVTNSAVMRTLPIGIFTLFQAEGQTIWGAVMAGTILVVAPVLVLYLWAQRYIVEGLAAGAVKG